MSFFLLTGVNVLSGSTWKGTKLRIGDAKPDYQQRSVIYMGWSSLIGSSEFFVLFQNSNRTRC